MPREVVALVSADDAVAAVRVHADRVHDLLRRSGCGAEESVEVTESYAFGLLDALVNAPETVGDMAGWWFGRALQLGRRLGDTAAEPADEASASVLAGTSGEAQVRAAVAALPENERAAVMLRDAYDLPIQAVAVALRRDEATAAMLVGTGRLHLLSRYDDRPPPDLGGHTGRNPADLATLTALADGTLPAARAVPLRRHLTTCPACEDVVDGLAKARRLSAALPIIAMPDEAREAMLERVAARAAATLPSVDEVLAVVEEDDDTRPAIAPLAVVLVIVLALILGVGVAALTRSGPGSAATNDLPPVATPATEQPSFSVSPTASLTPTPTASRTTRPSTRPSASRTPTAGRTTPTRGQTVASIVLTPTQGPRGTAITVDGTGWTAGDAVTVVYSGPISQSRNTATVAADGSFTATVTANGLVPGDYTVQATSSNATASAPFRQTS
ncbi:MAG: hypothetical protein QOD07_1069 [Frankiaceae bacterium]|nr:hypothetical protein [Frankiaceae bacterium]